MTEEKKKGTPAALPALVRFGEVEGGAGTARCEINRANAQGHAVYRPCNNPLPCHLPVVRGEHPPEAEGAKIRPGQQRVDVKVYMSVDLRDALDLLAVRLYGRGRRRNDVIENVLIGYVQRQRDEGVL
jgi:hypothetical protein